MKKIIEFIGVIILLIYVGGTVVFYWTLPYPWQSNSVISPIPETEVVENDDGKVYFPMHRPIHGVNITCPSDDPEGMCYMEIDGLDLPNISDFLADDLDESSHSDIDVDETLTDSD